MSLGGITVAEAVRGFAYASGNPEQIADAEIEVAKSEFVRGKLSVEGLEGRVERALIERSATAYEPLPLEALTG